MVNVDHNMSLLCVFRLSVFCFARSSFTEWKSSCCSLLILFYRNYHLRSPVGLLGPSMWFVFTALVFGAYMISPRVTLLVRLMWGIRRVTTSRYELGICTALNPVHKCSARAGEGLWWLLDWTDNSYNLTDPKAKLRMEVQSSFWNGSAD